MVDAIVSTILEQLISTAVQEAKERVQLVTGVEKEVEKLKKNLRAIKAVINDAERRQLKEESVRDWLDQLKDASYDVEDVLDQWNYARLKLQIEGVDEDALIPHHKKVCSFPTPCFGFKRVALRHDIARKIKEINENLDEIAKTKDMFHLNVTMSSEKSVRVHSTSMIDVTEIQGRDAEKNFLKSKLLCENSEEQEAVQLISMVGMGGIGKTALAQIVYNDNDVINNFEKRVWVCVSEPFDEMRIAKAIMEGLTGSTPNLSELQSLLQGIYASIARKKIFLVLDDVWTDDYGKWEPFRHCLKNGIHGSKILVTTRKEIVARMLESTHTISIGELSEEKCWSLFKKLAFSGRPHRECESLEDIGKKIVTKCKGLPLAVKGIGSLLRFKKTKEEWQCILDSEMWKLEEFEKGLLGPLLLSYNDLPSMVQRCFSYCAVFPKDYNIMKEELIQLWMAQGYLRPIENKEMEIIGLEYFDYLATRSFFQDFEKDDDGNVIECKMHDIVHDFAQYLCKGDCFAIEVHGLEESFINSFHNRACHSTLTLRNGASFPISICNVKRMRSLFVYAKYADSSLVSEALPKLIDNLKCLRVVDWRQNLIYEIPEEIGRLLHLRYLNLSEQEIKKLPETLCQLYNLQTLDITWCDCLEYLPQGIGNLVNLRHLLNDGCTSLSYMPAGIARLTRLQTLKVFVVGGGVHDGKACKLESLKSLNLFGGCTIKRLGNVSNHTGNAGRLKLQNMKNLVELVLDFSGHVEAGERENEDDQVFLETLQHPPHLKRLTLREYRGNGFSLNWMTSLANVRFLCLDYCRNWKHLPPLGKLLSLEILIIQKMAAVKKMGDEFLGINGDPGSSSSITAFPNLKHLTVSHMDELEEWDSELRSDGGKDIRIMPSLSSLIITACRKLKALPSYLRQMTALQSLTMVGSYIVERRCKEGTGEDWPLISHIPRITREHTADYYVHVAANMFIEAGYPRGQ